MPDISNIFESSFRYHIWWYTQAPPSWASCCLSCWIFRGNVLTVVFGNSIHPSLEKISWLHQCPKRDDLCFHWRCCGFWLFLVSNLSDVVWARIYNHYIQYEAYIRPTRISTTTGAAHWHVRRIFKYSDPHHNSSRRNIPSYLLVYFNRRRRPAAMFLHGLACGGFRKRSIIF